MKPLLRLVLGAATVLPALAQQPPFVYPAPPDAQVVRLKDVVYHKAAGRDIQMDFYRPASAAAGAKLPVLIFSNFIGGNPSVNGTSTPDGRASLPRSDSQPSIPTVVTMRPKKIS
jgi:enterochelin esterase-like enzyme